MKSLLLRFYLLAWATDPWLRGSATGLWIVGVCIAFCCCVWAYQIQRMGWMSNCNKSERLWLSSFTSADTCIGCKSLSYTPLASPSYWGSSCWLPGLPSHCSASLCHSYFQGLRSLTLIFVSPWWGEAYVMGVVVGQESFQIPYDLLLINP